MDFSFINKLINVSLPENTSEYDRYLKTYLSCIEILSGEQFWKENVGFIIPTRLGALSHKDYLLNVPSYIISEALHLEAFEEIFLGFVSYYAVLKTFSEGVSMSTYLKEEGYLEEMFSCRTRSDMKSIQVSGSNVEETVIIDDLKILPLYYKLVQYIKSTLGTVKPEKEGKSFYKVLLEESIDHLSHDDILWYDDIVNQLAENVSIKDLLTEINDEINLESENIQSKNSKILTSSFLKRIINLFVYSKITKLYNTYYIPSIHTATNLSNTAVRREGYGTLVICFNRPLGETDQVFHKIITHVIWSKIALLDLEEHVRLSNYHATKSAIISILVDSYAHNISAHSLAALKWWMQIRSERIFNKEILLTDDLAPLKKIISKDDLKSAHSASKKYLSRFDIDKPDNKTSLRDLIQFLDADKIDKLFKFKQGNQDGYFKFPIPIDYATYQFYKFLRDKASFWSGVTRDLSFGGESKNFYNTLWYDLVKNTLYLGTIAHSEGINKINFHIHLPNEYGGGTLNENNTEFAIIDLSILRYDAELLDPNEDTQNLSYKFLKTGKDFTTIKSCLSNSKYDVFFPSGIVGEHAFFTIIENTLRNIKHYEVTNELISNGINIHISIDPVWLMGETIPGGEKQLFKIKLWLDHTPIVKDTNQVLEELQFLSSEKVLNPKTNSPRLGGNSQDKICAAMLLNNTFISVDMRFRGPEFLRRDQYYCNEVDKNWICFEINEKKLQKIFFLWHAAKKVDLDDSSFNIEDNLFRFTFIICNDEKKSIKLREKGAIRIATTNSNAEVEWLKRWLNKEELLIIIEKDETPIHRLYIKGDSIQHTRESVEVNPQDVIVLNFNHGKEGAPDNDKTLELRNHATLLHTIFQETFENFIDSYPLGTENQFKLIEVIATKILIFDNRLYERYTLYKSLRKRALICKSLQLHIMPESISMNGLLNTNFHSVNFLVFHLSYLEKLVSKENLIDDFFETILFPNEEIIPENFILIITSGRGRTDFIQNSKPKYQRHVIFKPIESLLTAVEDALVLRDDFQIKYNISKVIFGS